MRKRMLKPIAAVAVFSVMLFGCAGSDTTTDDSTTMSETQTMEGDVAVDEAEVEVDVEADAAEMEADVAMDADANVNYDDMFDDLGDTKQYDVLALANSNQNLSTFVTLLEQAGMTNALKAGGPFTVFIPTNDAFNKLTQAQRTQLLDPKNKAQLVKVLQAHIIPSKVYASDLGNTTSIKTAQGNMINVLVEPNNNVTIGGARIVKPNVEASNGVVHVVNDIVMATDADGGLIDR